MRVSSLAGKPAPPTMLINVPRLIAAYYTDMPDFSVFAHRVAFGTSGHRGSSLENSFNEWHVLAISQAICLYRKRHGIGGPLFLGIDTHALSVSACASALEVLAANGVEVMLADKDEYTPTPVISHAIFAYNCGRDKGLADGIVITPSHNPTDNGGFKYNSPNGGSALTQAGVGFAIGAGTDVAMESADVVLMKSDPYDIVAAIELSRATLRKMHQNLWWAVGYNTIAFPLAAGVFYPFVLSPEVAAMSMSGSTLIVAINALMLKRTKLEGIRQPGKSAAPGVPGGPATPEAAKASAVPVNLQLNK